MSAYSVSVDSPRFNSKKKWSDRMRDVFVHQGKTWDDRVGMTVKNKIAGLVVTTPTIALNVHRRGPLDGLTSALLQKLRIPVDKGGTGATSGAPVVESVAPIASGDADAGSD